MCLMLPLMNSFQKNRFQCFGHFCLQSPKCVIAVIVSGPDPFLGIWLFTYHSHVVIYLLGASCTYLLIILPGGHLPHLIFIHQALPTPYIASLQYITRWSHFMYLVCYYRCFLVSKCIPFAVCLCLSVLSVPTSCV